MAPSTVMQKPATVAFVVIFGALLAALSGHEFLPPTAKEIKFQRRQNSGLEISMYKDGGSLGIHVLLRGGKEQVVFLDRRMVYVTPDMSRWVPKGNGLLYVGYDDMAASRPLQAPSPLGREFATLLQFERKRWLVRMGYFGREYLDNLDAFGEGFERTRLANKAADSTASAGTSAAEQPRVPASAASHL